MFRQPYAWREMEKLRREMNRLFENTLPRSLQQTASNFPAINVWANNNEGVIVTAELPGVASESVDVSVTGDTVTINGSRQPPASPQEVPYHRQERKYGEFSRTFQLPFSVNKESVEATLQKGVLLFSLPRAEAEKPRQIAIKSSA